MLSNQQSTSVTALAGIKVTKGCLKALNVDKRDYEVRTVAVRDLPVFFDGLVRGYQFAELTSQHHDYNKEEVFSHPAVRICFHDMPGINEFDVRSQHISVFLGEHTKAKDLDRIHFRAKFCCSGTCLRTEHEDTTPRFDNALDEFKWMAATVPHGTSMQQTPKKRSREAYPETPEKHKKRNRHCRFNLIVRH